MATDTLVRVKLDTWQRLQSSKTGPGDTVDKVIRRLLDESKVPAAGRGAGQPAHTPVAPPPVPSN